MLNCVHFDLHFLAELFSCYASAIKKYTETADVAGIQIRLDAHDNGHGVALIL